MPASMSQISPRHGVPRPALPTIRVSAMKVLAADRAASGSPCSATLSTCETIFSTTGSCNTPLARLAAHGTLSRGAGEGLECDHAPSAKLLSRSAGEGGPSPAGLVGEGHPAA